MIARRNFLLGMPAAPAIVRASSLMHVVPLRVVPAEIASIDIVNSGFMVHFADGSVIGPLPLPLALPMAEFHRLIQKG